MAKRLIALLRSRNLLRNDDFHYISLHSHNESTRLATLPSDFWSNDIIFMSDAGMPSISDPGAKLAAFAQKNSIAYTIIPGVSSVLCALALSGFEAKDFKCVGFLPHKKLEKIAFLREMLNEKCACVFLESPKRIVDSLDMLSNLAPEREIFIAKEITKLHERFYFGSVAEVAASVKSANLNGEWIGVISAESTRNARNALHQEDIEALEIPPKIKAKILAKLTDSTPKECYARLIGDNAKNGAGDLRNSHSGDSTPFADSTNGGAL